MNIERRIDKELRALYDNNYQIVKLLNPDLREYDLKIITLQRINSALININR